MRALVDVRTNTVRHLRRLLTLACLLALIPATRAWGHADAIQDFGRGAVGAFNTCASQPNGDYLCNDFIVQYFADQNTVTGAACFEHYEAFVHPDGTADEFVAEFGCTYPVSGAYDAPRLTFARMSAATISLNVLDPSTGAVTPNGRTAILGPFEWVAASDIYVFGRDGPFGLGLPHLLVERCATQIYNTHERFPTAHVTGTINGISVAEYGPSYLPWPGTGPADALGAIFDLRINHVAASHSGGC